MSMILDALRKSDRQRARLVAERLREGPSPVNPGHAHGWMIALFAAVMLLSLAAIAISIPLENAATSETERYVTELPANDPAPVRPLSGELASDLQPAREPASPAQDRPATPREPLTPAAIVDNLGAPPLARLPAAFRLRLPSLHVDVHAWAEDPSARFVLINLRRYQEGDRLEEGPTLRRILKNGVVLEFEGTLFSLSK